jgi:hypothetical protein
MSEPLNNLNPEQSAPEELQQPPALTDNEASAVLQVQAYIGAARLGSEGVPVYGEVVSGVTKDRIFVSVDRRLGGDGTEDDGYVVRVGNVSELAMGGSLQEHKLPIESPGTYNFRGGNPFIISSEFGVISGPNRRYRETMPKLDGNLLFPIGEDGRPLTTDASAVAERVQPEPLASLTERASVGGLRRFLSRFHK